MGLIELKLNRNTSIALEKNLNCIKKIKKQSNIVLKHMAEEYTSILPKVLYLVTVSLDMAI